MSKGQRAKGKHSGRAKGERGQRILTMPDFDTTPRRQREKREEAEWAARSGPVTVRRKDDDAQT